MRKTLKKKKSEIIKPSISKCACCKKELRLVSIDVFGNEYCSRECLKTLGILRCNTCETYSRRANMIYIDIKDSYCCKGKCANLNDYVECFLCEEYKKESTLLIKENKSYCMGCVIKNDSLSNYEEDIVDYDEENLNTFKADFNIKNIIKPYPEEIKLINYIINEDKKYIEYLKIYDKDRLEKLLERYLLMKEMSFISLGFEPLYYHDRKVKNVFKLVKNECIFILSISVLFYINSNGQLKELHNLNKFDNLHIIKDFVDSKEMIEFGLYIDIHDIEKNIVKRGE